MRRTFIAFASLCVALLAAWQSFAQISVTGAANQKPPSAAPPAFSGMGDVVSGAFAAHSLRAYSAATRGNKLVNVCNSTGGIDVGCGDLSSDATTGNLVAATISAITCPGNANCTIKTFYDISGNTNCSGPLACDATQATVANRAVFVANGSLFCAAFTRASSMQYSSGSTVGTGAQPFTMSAVAKRTGNVTSSQSIFSVLGQNTIIFFNSSANQAGLFAGSTLAATANDNTYHAMQGIINGGSSTLYIDGSATNGSAGTNTGNGAVRIGNDGFNDFLDGVYCESGFWLAGFNGTQQSNMNSNQHSYWGF